MPAPSSKDLTDPRGVDELLSAERYVCGASLLPNPLGDANGVNLAPDEADCANEALKPGELIDVLPFGPELRRLEPGFGEMSLSW